MLVTLGLLAALVVLIFRLFRSDRDRVRLLIAVAVGAGLVLLNVPGVHRLIQMVGRPLVETAHLAGYSLGPLALMAGTCWVVWRLVRVLWRRWPERHAVGRGGAVLGSIVAGLFMAVLLRSSPLMSEVAQVTEYATAEGVRAAWDAAWDKAGNLLMGFAPTASRGMEESDPTAYEQVQVSSRVSAAGPFQAECLVFALAIGQQHRVCGGPSEAEPTMLRRARRSFSTGASVTVEASA
jgi:hypothetical protein